jgi:hypothetical protein
MHMYGCTCILIDIRKVPIRSMLTATSRLWCRSFQGQVYSKGGLLANGCQIEVCFVYYNLQEDVKDDGLVAKIVRVHYIEKSSRLLFASWQQVLVNPPSMIRKSEDLPPVQMSLTSFRHFCLVDPFP